MSSEKRYYVPPEIVALREELVTSFMAGNADPEVLRKLRDFAVSVRDKPRVEVEARPKRGRWSNVKAIQAQMEADPRRFMRVKPAIRQKGSRFLIVDGKRKLIPMTEIENAIRNGARYPERISAQHGAAADTPGSAAVRLRGDNGLSCLVAEYGLAPGSGADAVRVLSARDQGEVGDADQARGRARSDKVD